MRLEILLQLLLAIGGAGFLFGSLWQLRGRPGSLLTADTSAPSRMDRAAVAVTWVGIAFAAVSGAAGRWLRGSALLDDHVPLLYAALVAVVLIAAPIALLRRRSRCQRCGRQVVPEDECPYCEGADVSEHGGGSARLF
jgi:hypothetical protein